MEDDDLFTHGSGQGVGGDVQEVEEDLGCEDLEAEGSGADDDRGVPQDQVPPVRPTAVPEAPVGGNGLGRGRASRRGYCDKPRGLFLLSLSRLPLFLHPLSPSSFSAPAVFLSPSAFCPPCPLPSSFACTRCPLPSFCYVHSLTTYFLVFALAVPLPCSLPIAAFIQFLPSLSPYLSQ